MGIKKGNGTMTKKQEEKLWDLLNKTWAEQFALMKVIVELDIFLSF